MTVTPPESTVAAQAPEPQEHPWASLAPAPYRLLRLFPQPVDRTTGARPLRFAQYSRLERHSPQESLLRVRVDLPGQSVSTGQNQLDVWVDHGQKAVRFAPDSALRMTPPNRGLGRFLLAQGIDWAQRKWPNYQVQRGELPNKNLLSEDDRLRRDQALRSQGFDVVYPDDGQLKAHFGAPTMSALIADWNTEKVQILDTLDAANMLEQADQKLREQDATLRKQEERITWLQREDSGLRFTVTCLVAFALFQAGLLIWIATR